MKKEFEKKNTIALKGIAVTLMLMHHLWAFDERIYGGALKSIFRIFDYTSIHIMGLFGKICVSLFFFLGGYGIYISSKNKKFSILNKIKKLYISYWKVFLVFVPLGFLVFSNTIPYCESSDIYLRFSTLDWKIVINDFLGLTSNLNREWWFLKSYVLALVTFPFLKMVIDKKDIKTNIFLIIIFAIMTTNVFPTIGNIKSLGNLNSNFLYYSLFCQGAPYIACFWMGILFAKENLIIKFGELIDNVFRLNIVTDLIILIIIIYLRELGIGDSLDIIYVPVFVIVCNHILNKLKLVNKLFYAIGKESTNIWLIHSFYCYYFYPVVKIVVGPKWAVLSLLVLLVLSYTSSIILEHFWKFIRYIVSIVSSFTRKKIKIS